MPHREKLIKNFTYLEEVSQASCQMLEAMVPNFKEISIHVGDLALRSVLLYFGHVQWLPPKKRPESDRSEAGRSSFNPTPDCLGSRSTAQQRGGAFCSAEDMSKESDEDVITLAKVALLGGEVTEQVP